MKSDDVTIQELFSDRRQFMVPFYQRAYVWTMQDQWSQLWEDIQAKAEARVDSAKPTPHFLGAVVLDPQKSVGLRGVPTLHIIDGQQRITTMQYVLRALWLAFHETDQRELCAVLDQCLENGNEQTMRHPEVERFKVWPTFKDQVAYKAAMTAPSTQELRERFPDSFTQRQTIRLIGIQHPRALESIWFFMEQFCNWIRQPSGNDTATRAEAVAQAILDDFKVVSIVLDESDDAQVIFETLNGRGARLHATDLIRNFLFMQADREGADSAALYETLWKQFEDPMWSEQLRRGRIKKPRLEWFVHAALQAQTGDEVDLGRLYHEYRDYVTRNSSHATADLQLQSLDQWSGHYLALSTGEGPLPVARLARRLLPFEVTTIHPLALMISATDLNHDDKHTIFEDLVSYVLRRAICGLTTKNYNNVFMQVLRSVSAQGASPQTVHDALSQLSRDTTRWPSDNELLSACINRPIYPGEMKAAQLRAIFAELEDALRGRAKTESAFNAELEGLDVEHILPQSWCEHWPLMSGRKASATETMNLASDARLGELTSAQEEVLERQSALKTLGNLTLLNLSVNRTAQNKDFSIKKRLLIANTSLRLNVELLSHDDWNEEKIRERAVRLGKLAIAIWPGPG